MLVLILAALVITPSSSIPLKGQGSDDGSIQERLILPSGAEECASCHNIDVSTLPEGLFESVLKYLSDIINGLDKGVKHNLINGNIKKEIIEKDGSNVLAFTRTDCIETQVLVVPDDDDVEVNDIIFGGPDTAIYKAKFDPGLKDNIFSRIQTVSEVPGEGTYHEFRATVPATLIIHHDDEIANENSPTDEKSELSQTITEYVIDTSIPSVLILEDSDEEADDDSESNNVNVDQPKNNAEKKDSQNVSTSTTDGNGDKAKEFSKPPHENSSVRQPNIELPKQNGATIKFDAIPTEVISTEDGPKLVQPPTEVPDKKESNEKKLESDNEEKEELESDNEDSEKDNVSPGVPTLVVIDQSEEEPESVADSTTKLENQGLEEPNTSPTEEQKAGLSLLVKYFEDDTETQSYDTTKGKRAIGDRYYPDETGVTDASPDEQSLSDEPVPTLVVLDNTDDLYYVDVQDIDDQSEESQEVNNGKSNPLENTILTNTANVNRRPNEPKKWYGLPYERYTE